MTDSERKLITISCSDRSYIPNPLRCFHYQRSVHVKTTCSGSITLARCAEISHDNKYCQEAIRCVNCKGDHAAISHSCVNWIREKEIIAVKFSTHFLTMQLADMLNPEPHRYGFHTLVYESSRKNPKSHKQPNSILSTTK